MIFTYYRFWSWEECIVAWCAKSEIHYGTYSSSFWCIEVITFLPFLQWLYKCVLCVHCLKRLNNDYFCRNGSNINGYFTWSFIDVYELLTGYETSYGLFYVDLDDPDRKRYPRLSAKWYSNFLKGKASTSLDFDPTTEELLFYS